MRNFLTVLIIFSLFSAISSAAKPKQLKVLNEANWRDVLNGEWMIEFHAPWCPACKDLQKAWYAFAEWSNDLNVNVAEIDVTTNPGLSGRFLVTALPTIYHVKNGVFRSYVGARDKNDFISFVEDKRWSLVDPIPSYKHPDSPQMGIVAVFFQLSMSVRDLHNHFVENIGVPPWVSYAGFAAVTLLLGCILGFFIVCIIDYVFPTGAIIKKLEEKKAQQERQQQKKAGQKDHGKNNKKATKASDDEKSSENSAKEDLNNNSTTDAEKSEKSTPKPAKKDDSKKNK